jgi:hypothetical protein
LSQSTDSGATPLRPALATPNVVPNDTSDKPNLQANDIPQQSPLPSNPINSPSASTSTTPSQATAAPSTSTQAKGEKVSMPTRIAGCVAGTFVGVPVCMVRRSKYENWFAVHGMIGDSDNKFARATLSTLWFPFAVVTGVCESPIDGLTNAVRNSSKPFSKDQFSLGELKQNHE